MDENQLRRQVERLKKEIGGLEIARPGTLYESHSVCGKAGCRCGRKTNPIKHGPYLYLSYTFDGQSHTEFVPRGHEEQIKQEVANYQRLMELVKELVAANIQRSKLRRRKS